MFCDLIISKDDPEYLTYALGLTFMIGILLSPWSAGVLFFLLFAVAAELYYYYRYRNTIYWDHGIRLGLFCAGFLGWLMGREISGDHEPMKTLENPKKEIMDKLHSMMNMMKKVR